MNTAHTIADLARSMGYAENHIIITTMQQEWWAAFNRQKEYKAQYDQIANKWNQYPVAAYIWKYMHDTMGLNDYVCAGIMGNMMKEAGGHTLNIQPTAYNKAGFYGICQWSNKYYHAYGMSLEQQCDLLARTIKNEFDTFGFLYYRGFNYNAFINLQDEKQAALAYVKCYGRGGQGTYAIRQKFATYAYNFFTTL